MQEWTLISAVNDEQVLKSCLLSSPCIREASEVILQRGFAGAGLAYNAAIRRANTDLLVFAHQDIYFPEGWIEAVRDAIAVLTQRDSDWGVLGVWGPCVGGGRAGHVYDGGQRRVLGRPFKGGIEVESLDEVVLIFRKSTELLFDSGIPGFHMYGTDICLESKRRGRRNYAIGGLCIHNTNEYGMLPWQFWKAYLAMRRKWRSQLPVQTTCIRITVGCWPMFRYNFVRGINLATGRDPKPLKRLEDPRLALPYTSV